MLSSRPFWAATPPRTGGKRVSWRDCVPPNLPTAPDDELFFIGTLPATCECQVKPQGVSPQRIEEAMATSTYRPVILAVEDDPPVRTLLRDIFIEAGYEVMLA